MSMGWSWPWSSSPAAGAAASSPLSSPSASSPSPRNDTVNTTPPTPPTPPTGLPSSTTTTPTNPDTPSSDPPYTPLPEPLRLRRQLTLLLSGPAFLSLSLLLTRRSLRRKALSAFPPFYHPNLTPPATPPPGALDALEALNLATLNISAFALILVGGGMFALDVCDVEELRRRVRGEDGAGGDLLGEEYKELKRREREAEEEVEEWMVAVLARKEVRERARRRVDEMEGGGG